MLLLDVVDDVAQQQMLDPVEAGALVRDQLTPAILATGADDHLMLVLSTEVEALTISQVERVTGVLAELCGRTDRALRHRRKVQLKRAPAA